MEREDNRLPCINGVWNSRLAYWLGVADIRMVATSPVSTWKAAESLQLNMEGRQIYSRFLGAFPMDLHK